jgi:hypothetical protein
MSKLHEPRPAATRAPAGAPTARRWMRPTVSKMRAGEAEIGPNPDNADGPFTFS